MIISKTPLRISFVGGGSDIESFYSKSVGAVVSTAIDKYVYITVNKKFDNHIRVSYSKTEEVAHVDDIDHKLVREILKFHKIKGSVEITSIADIPSRGTGMGSSSSFSVGLLHCLYAYKNKYISAERLARESCYIEIQKCKEPIGKQDQYTAAYGGFNFIQFNIDGSVKVEPLIFQKKTRDALKRSLLLFYTGVTRSASEVLREQNNNISMYTEKRKMVEKMVELTYSLREDLQRNRLDTFGEILHKNWILKKSLTGSISNPQIDKWYEVALKNGAIGGKLLGAGGGGFLLFFAHEQKHKSIIKALRGLRYIPFDFDTEGSKIIFVHN
jgi:D-glycero-alpha-D-manno-heptose-7-phosphate kinase